MVYQHTYNWPENVIFKTKWKIFIVLSYPAVWKKNQANEKNISLSSNKIIELDDRNISGYHGKDESS